MAKNTSKSMRVRKFTMVREAIAVVLQSYSKAIFIEYLDALLEMYESNPSSYKDNFKDGRWWHWHTYEQWGKALPGLSSAGWRKAITQLKDSGLLLAEQHGKGQNDNTTWYSLDGAKLEDLITKGEEQLYVLRGYKPEAPVRKYQGVVSESSKRSCPKVAEPTCPKVSSNTETIEKPILEEGNYTSGISADAEFPSPTSSRCSSAGSESSPPLFPTARKEGQAFPPVSPTPQAGMHERHLATYTERFKKTGSPVALEKVWQITVVDTLGSGSFVAFTARDKKNAKSDLTKWCEASSMDPVKFMTWAITNWMDIRAILKWAKLPDTPTFQQFFGLKDKFAVLYKELRKKEKSGTVRRVYNSPADVPDNHPRRAALLKGFKDGAKSLALEEEV